MNIDGRKKHILVVNERPTQGLDNTAIKAES